MIISLVNLNGLIHESKVRHIYMELFQKQPMKKLDVDYLEKNFVRYDRAFFVHDSLFRLKDKSDLLDAKNSKPYYKPTLKELKDYMVDDYYEQNTEYYDVYNHLYTITMNEEVTDDIIFDFILGVKIDLDIEGVISLLLRNDIELKEEDFKKTFELFIIYAGTIRSWVNNGFTLNELKNMSEITKKIGRNELCPCGSGKKYKKCCIDKPCIESNEEVYYENVFEVNEGEKKKLRSNLGYQMTKVYFHIMNIEEPSLEDLISDVSNFGAEFAIENKPQDIVGSLLFILFRRHNINFTDKRLETLLKTLRVYGKRKELENLSYYVERECLGDYMELDSFEIKQVIDQIYMENRIKPLMEIPKKNRFQFLKTIYEEVEFDIDMAKGFEKLAINVLESDIANKKLELYKIIFLYPFLPFVLYEFLPGNNNTEKILLLESIIKSYEIRYQDEIENYNFDLTIEGDSKIYILAIDSLAFFEKERGNHKRSIELYNKAITLDPSNKYGYKEANLVNYVLSNQLDLFDKKLTEVDDDSLYKIFISLLNKLIKEEPFHHEYIKAYETNKLLLDVICHNDFFLIDEYDHNAKLFAQDFLEFFTKDKRIINQLKDIHMK